MYYIIYAIFYLLSLLPWWLIYLLSDFVYLILFYVTGYRKEVVMKNLSIAFPEKTEKERTLIAKEFYHNFCDTFIETIKLLSISDDEFARRYTTNSQILAPYYEAGSNIYYLAGHFFNWEFVNYGESRYGKFPFVGVYMPITNKAFDRLMLKLRSRYGTILVTALNFKTSFRELVPGRYALGLAADQNPGNPQNAYWVSFFNRLTPFVKGPERGARASNNPVFFGHFYKTKRGHYHLQVTLITETPRELSEGELTRQYAGMVENAVRQKPANYLWSHRRWKWAYEDKYADLVVKTTK
ncbi:MAG: hypothetical protein RLZZ28_1083 [Bacteroidota bacterium]|jgi:KDO2-lipid IV(A) lauroyltransferase